MQKPGIAESNRRRALVLPTEEFIALYRAGKTVNQIAAQYGLNASTVKRRLIGSGIQPVPPSVRATPEIVRMYTMGASIPEIAKELGFNEKTISSVLHAQRIVLRSQPETLKLKMARLSADQRAELTKKANEATRGRKVPMDEQLRSAAGRQRTGGIRIGPQERELQRMLEERGLVCIPQCAVGPYNCDLAVDSIAVEVFGGDWHFSGRSSKTKLRHRSKYFLDSGWHMVVIHISARYPLTTFAADYVVAFADEARGLPAMPRQYRVIRGTGEAVTTRRGHFDEVTLPVARHCSQDADG